MISKYKKLNLKNILLVTIVVTLVGIGIVTNNITKVNGINNKFDNNENYQSNNDPSTDANSNSILHISDIIQFRDSTFENTIRAQLKNPSGNIQKSDLLKIKELDLKYKSIIYLDDLQYFENLESLDLSGINVSDISPLKNLKSLRSLNLSVNFNIKDNDISVLSYLTDLENLDISKGKISDLTPLSNLKKLKVLKMNYNQIMDLTPIRNLAQLTEIDLSDNFSNNISVLENLTELKTLKITSLPVGQTDINALKKILPNCNIDRYGETENYKRKTHSQIMSLGFTGYKQHWVGNGDMKNAYAAEFKLFNGTELYEIEPTKTSYNIILNSNITEGSLIMKIYNNNKILYEKTNPLNETITISKEDVENLKVQCIGSDAVGNYAINVN